jgi:hypothetical protein
MPKQSTRQLTEQEAMRKLLKGLIALTDALKSEISNLEVTSGIADLRSDLKEAKRSLKQLTDILRDSYCNNCLFTMGDIVRAVPGWILNLICEKTNVDVDDVRSYITSNTPDDEEDTEDVDDEEENGPDFHGGRDDYEENKSKYEQEYGEFI